MVDLAALLLTVSSNTDPEATARYTAGMVERASLSLLLTWATATFVIRSVVGDVVDLFKTLKEYRKPRNHRHRKPKGAV